MLRARCESIAKMFGAAWSFSFSWWAVLHDGWGVRVGDENTINSFVSKVIKIAYP